MSKKAMKRDAKKRRTEKLCLNFLNVREGSLARHGSNALRDRSYTQALQGKCEFGDSCKYSHDAQAAVEAKPADLPGVCPFELGRPGEPCRFGIMCRYLGSHT